MANGKQTTHTEKTAPAQGARRFFPEDQEKKEEDTLDAQDVINILGAQDPVAALLKAHGDQYDNSLERALLFIACNQERPPAVLIDFILNEWRLKGVSVDYRMLADIEGRIQELTPRELAKRHFDENIPECANVKKAFENYDYRWYKALLIWVISLITVTLSWRLKKPEQQEKTSSCMQEDQTRAAEEAARTKADARRKQRGKKKKRATPVHGSKTKTTPRAKPAKPAKPAEPAKPAKPAEPAEPAKPAETRSLEIQLPRAKQKRRKEITAKTPAPSDGGGSGWTDPSSHHQNP